MTDTDLDKHPVAPSGDLIESVPVIDVGRLIDDSGSAAAQPAIAAIAAACRDWGFFQIVNHGVRAALIDALWRHTRRFFAAPSATKEAVLRTRDNPWGYYHNELTKNQRDKKEVFDFTREGVDAIYGSCNRWPAGDPALRGVALEYYDACTTLSLKLLEAFCLGLDLPATTLHPDFAGTHTGFIRLNYYPVRDPLQGAALDHLPVADMGVHHHSDAGVLTVLLQDDVGGLQVHREGAWHNVAPVQGAFVVNTGDMMQVWSNDRYRAAIHRVRAMEARDRYSIPFFFNPSATSKVAPLPDVVGAAGHSHYDVIDWAEFRGRRTDGDYADYGDEVQIAQFRR